ncbi:hypothetical protein KGY71_03840, partial [Candidatus Bipolaricaulota bacterium]|nr:hypothetical protein [Candidatus Bipolaricaulota bacterium]
VFSVHFGLTLISIMIGGGALVVFPLFVPELNLLELFVYIPIIFVFDFGLVSLVAYFLEGLNIEWNIDWLAKFKKPVISPRISSLGWLVSSLIVGSFLHFYFGSIFVFLRPLDRETIPLTEVLDLEWLSTFVLLSLFVSTLAYIIRFFHNSESINLVKGVLDLIILSFLMRYSLTLNDSSVIDQFDLQILVPLMKGIYVFVVAIVVFEMVRSSLTIILDNLHQPGTRPRTPPRGTFLV